MIKPQSQTTIEGEACLVRYLAHMTSLRYNDADPITATIIDEWIDLACHQLINGSSKEQGAAFKTMNAILGKQRYLTTAAGVTAADVFAWSAIRQLQLTPPSNVKRWLAELDAHPAFRSALKLV